MTDMTKRAYTDREERIARFAKAMGHPARMAILRFLAAQESSLRCCDTVAFAIGSTS